MSEYVEDVFEELKWDHFLMVDVGELSHSIASQIAKMDDEQLATLVGKPLAYGDEEEQFAVIKKKLAELKWNDYVGISPAEQAKFIKGHLMELKPRNPNTN